MPFIRLDDPCTFQLQMENVGYPNSVYAVINYKKARCAYVTDAMVICISVM